MGIDDMILTVVIQTLGILTVLTIVIIFHKENNIDPLEKLYSSGYGWPK